jgi:hypothetical protein
MTARTVLLVLLVAFTFPSSTVLAGRRWDPGTAVADARRDIAEHHLRFCFIGGYVPHPIGVPDSSYRIVSRYPRIEVGDQGCIRSKNSDVEHEYARLYNEEMWRYVSRKPR